MRTKRRQNEAVAERSMVPPCMLVRTLTTERAGDYRIRCQREVNARRPARGGDSPARQGVTGRGRTLFERKPGRDAARECGSRWCCSLLAPLPLAAPKGADMSVIY